MVTVKIPKCEFLDDAKWVIEEVFSRYLENECIVQEHAGLNEYRIEFNGRAIILNYEFKFSAENWLKPSTLPKEFS